MTQPGEPDLNPTRSRDTGTTAPTPDDPHESQAEYADDGYDERQEDATVEAAERREEGRDDQQR